MTDADQTEAFAIDIDALISRYRAEFDLTLAGAIGVLEIAKLQLFSEQMDELHDDE